MAEEADTLRDLVDDQAADEYQYRHFNVSGQYDVDRQILLDNMISNGRVGYHVLTPFRIGNEAVVVNRGWVPADPDRSILPDISINDDFREISGRLDTLRRPGMKIKSSSPDVYRSWPRRLLYPNATELGNQIGYKVHDYQLLLDDDAPDGFVRIWKPTLMNPERHVAYAVQWFALALAAMAIYVVVNRRARDGIAGNE